MEQRLKAEAAAKAQAETEARAKAEAETKARAEAEEIARKAAEERAAAELETARLSKERMNAEAAMAAVLSLPIYPELTPAQQAAAAANPAVTGRAALVEGLDGLQITKPPYGVIAGIDLNQNGKLIFQVPHGDTPDNVRNHPLLRGLDIPKTGQGSSVGIMVTKTMLVAGDPQITQPPGRARGAMLRAYDKKTGQEVGAVYMSGPQSGTPMTYRVDGRQYIVVATSGGNQSGEYVAYALPESARTR